MRWSLAAIWVHSASAASPGGSEATPEKSTPPNSLRVSASVQGRAAIDGGSVTTEAAGSGAGVLDGGREGDWDLASCGVWEAEAGADVDAEAEAVGRTATRLGGKTGALKVDSSLRRLFGRSSSLVPIGSAGVPGDERRPDSRRLRSLCQGLSV